MTDRCCALGIICILCWTHLAVAARISSHARQQAFAGHSDYDMQKEVRSEEGAEAQAGCSSQSTCTACLMAGPKYSFDTFCKWCPQEYWYGSSKSFLVNASGVCRQASRRHDVCGGGSKWVIHRGVKPDGEKAPSAEAAGETCPENDDPAVLTWKQTALQSLTAKKFAEPRLLAVSLLFLNLDIQRLRRLHATHPLFFEDMFSKSKKTVAANYAWKLSVWGLTWIPVVGGGISLGLGLATSAAEHSVEVYNELLESQQITQANLCSKGRKAGLEYFTDVTYGLVQNSYRKILEKNNISDLEAKHKKTLSRAKAGKRLGKADTALKSGYAKVGKALVHSGLFVSGFFTMGITWLVSAGLGLAEFSVEWSIAWGAAKTLKDKSLLLVDLARAADRSEWTNEHATRCDITAWDSGVNPCPDIPDPEDDPNSRRYNFIRRVCVRSSSWDHHEDVLPRGEFSPEGICVPRGRAGLEDGLPCVTHEACSSSYCHFEPRQLYFFSDHDRQYCEVGDTSCTPAIQQLHKMQMSQMAPDEESIADLAKFTGDYKGSFKGPMYATTGTCATACASTEVGRGNCAAISAGAIETPGTNATKFDFGVRQENRLFVNEQQGYELVGHGHCGTTLGIEGEGFRNLQSAFEGDIPHGEEVLQACAKKCFDGQSGRYSSFTVDIKSGECFLHEERADVAPKIYGHGPDGHTHVQCYSTLHWPHDGYQPWNIEWMNYRSDLDAILAALTNDFDKGKAQAKALEAVREAFKQADFCRGIADCPHPDEWDADDAARTLRFSAPLSAEQLHQIHEKIDPGSTEQLAKAGQQIKLRDMLNRRHGFGAAWHKFFEQKNYDAIKEELRRYDDGEPEGPSTSKFDLSWVQRLESKAMQQKLRTADDEWDLVAADALTQ